MIMRFRPANIRLINRRSKLLRLLLALSSGKENANHQNNPTDLAQLTPSLHIRPTALPAPNGRSRFLVADHGSMSALTIYHLVSGIGKDVRVSPVTEYNQLSRRT